MRTKEQEESGPPRRRAEALPAAERRERIIEATTPLLLANGRAITTRQIAGASGIAEGTIFRVFEDKESVIDAVVAAAFDPSSFEADVNAIDASLDFEDRLIEAAGLLQRRVAEIGELMTAVGLTRAPGDTSPAPTSIDALSTLFEGREDRLRRPPRECARLLRALTFAGTHPVLVVDGPTDPREIVSLLLHGVTAQC